MDGFSNLFKEFKEKLLNIDPVSFCENNLTLDGDEFRLNGNGYKPFADIYRYIAIKAVEKDSKKVVLVKGRQVGATTMAAALECYFTTCGLFGNNKRPPVSILHLFPTMAMAASYTKDKLDPMIGHAKPMPGLFKSNGAPKSFVESRIDSSSPSNSSLHYKKFLDDNKIWIESTGITGDRIRGRSASIAFFDECFPYRQCIETNSGKVKIGRLYKLFKNGEKLPLVKTFNEKKETFEYKRITNAWKRGKRELVQVVCGNRKIQCTPNHKFLTQRGWVSAANLCITDLVKTTQATLGQICYCLNSDQEQVMLGSFLGDGHISCHGKGKYRVREQHAMAQLQYCSWKANIFGTKCNDVEKNGYSQKPAVYYSTKLFGYDKDFPKIKNHCPQWVLDRLDERGLAVWFMDDGSVHNKNATIYTSSFDEESQKRIVKKLEGFGIEAKYREYFYKNRGKNYYAIYINKENYLKLCDLIRKYVHNNLSYKVDGWDDGKLYEWNNAFKEHGLIPVKKVKNISKTAYVYDIEVEDNHNFIASSGILAKNNSGIIVHNCQDISHIAVGAVTKVLAQSPYGANGEGVQVYYGTPKQKGGHYWKMWQKSSQQYFHLRCEKCDELFPLYRPDINWEDVWLYGYIVKCTTCGHEQDKRQAADRGQWVSMNPDADDPKLCPFVGYHINQLYIPRFEKETIIKAKPEWSATNTEKIYQNEVLGEFYDGEGGTISIEEIHEKCSDPKRSMAASITPSRDRRVYAGFDWGQRSALDQLSGRGRGKSYSCGVVITAHGPRLFSVDFATRLSSNEQSDRIETVEEIFRRYGIYLAVGDIGDASSLTNTLQRMYPERFLASRVSNQVNGHVKFRDDIFPKEIVFEKNHYISELIGLLKEGAIRFPYKNYDKIDWLINHCASMEVKITVDRSGDPIKHYVKGAAPNDGFMALLNAYLAWKYDVTYGFKIKQPHHMQYEIASGGKSIPAIVGYLPKFRTYL